MNENTDSARLTTGVRNLDALFEGGLPKGTVAVLSGPPGAGKTILAQQICFHNANPDTRVLYFNTLSEPTAKTLRYLSLFKFFDARKLDAGMQFVDLGLILRADGLEPASKLIMEHVKKVKPSIVVVDSFKAFDDLAKSHEELRKFGYELAVNLMAWEVTALLLGEYGAEDLQTNPLFSVVDGLLTLHQREQSGEQQRFIQISKMRGTEHSRDEHSFVITDNGIEVFAPRVTIHREDRRKSADTARLKTGISKLDELLGDGIPLGSSLLIAGVAGTGKTVLGLEFVYRGAQAGEKGIVFSFEETEERLRATARGLGWDLDREIERGMVEIVFIPQPDIMVEGHLLMMRERVEAMGAKRVVIDSVSVFLHKVKDPQIAREKTFQLATIVQNAQAVGFLTTDIPYGSSKLSRFGVEETVVDGVIVLTSTEEAFERQRYIEVYKLRNTAHSKGRHNLVIGQGGMQIFPRYSGRATPTEPPPVEISRRLPSGVAGLDGLLGGGLLERSATVVSGSAGIGKTTLGLQFILEGVKKGEPGLYVALEEGPAQILKIAEALALPLGDAVESGLVEIVYLSREHVRANQFLTILTDKIQARKARRLVLDSASHLVTQGLSTEELRELLYSLVGEFKARGVTSLLTLESQEMYATGSITDGGFSPVADNIVLLRYAQVQGAMRPTLAVVKTRGSHHDRGTWYFEIATGGLRVAEQIDARAPRPAKASRERRSPKRR
ncbi:MAG: AAA family ATPase [Actinobacteria bacterium]|nr:AAA family ATPase [Actinomycetota bacterium]